MGSIFFIDIWLTPPLKTVSLYYSKKSNLAFKMLQKHAVEGFDDFKAKAEELSKEDVPLYVYFSGSKTSDGKSWCPDCVTAQPVVEATLEKELKEPANYFYVGVGDRTFWKDPNCIFRTNALTKLKSVPTLFKWGAAGNRLEEEKCAKPDFITMLFDE